MDRSGPFPRQERGRPGPGRFLFDVWSRFYDVPLVQRLAYHPVHDAVVEELRDLRGRRVLDVGCGTGQLATRLAEDLGASVTGCDFSPGMLDQAAARSRTPGWVQGDAVRLPFRDESFDAIVSTEAFHWFPDQPAALAEVRRVLVPGGRVLVGLINPPFSLGGQAAAWPSRRRMAEMVEGAGLRLRDQRRVFRPPAGLVLAAVLTVATRP